MFILVAYLIFLVSQLNHYLYLMEKTIHQGRNITRFRNMLGMKQDLLASIMGEDWTQLKVSRLEQKEEIEPAILEVVAKALKIPVEALKNFDEEAAVNIIANSFHEHSTLNGINYYPTFNPVDKVVEILERSIKEKDDIIRELIAKLPSK
jgi:transcriptional regulator with XRE-family HTH domain